MSFYIKKPSIVDNSLTVYYAGDRRWSDDFSQRKIYEENPESIMNNEDGKNGGWSNCTIVTEN